MNKVIPVLMLVLGFVVGTSVGVAYAIGVIDLVGDVVVDGTLTIQDGTQGFGKVFTSDVAGTGSWQDIPAGPSGVLGFYTVETNNIFGPNQEGSVPSALCEIGDIATGGGFSGDISGSLNVRTNAPVLSSGIPVGWAGSFENIGSSNNRIFLTAVCADITP